MKECTFGIYEHVKVDAATGGVLWKKVFLKISQNSQENSCTRDSFNEVIVFPYCFTLMNDKPHTINYFYLNSQHFQKPSINEISSRWWCKPKIFIILLFFWYISHNISSIILLHQQFVNWRSCDRLCELLKSII